MDSTDSLVPNQGLNLHLRTIGEAHFLVCETDTKHQTSGEKILCFCQTDLRSSKFYRHISENHFCSLIVVRVSLQTSRNFQFVGPDYNKEFDNFFFPINLLYGKNCFLFRLSISWTPKQASTTTPPNPTTVNYSKAVKHSRRLIFGMKDLPS